MKRREISVPRFLLSWLALAILAALMWLGAYSVVQWTQERWASDVVMARRDC